MNREQMIERYGETMIWRERLLEITPGGAQTMSKRGAAFGTEAYPAALVRGEEGRVWDVDGNEYVDLICGLAAVGLGYGIESINGAVHRQIERGVSFSLATRLECEVAEQLVQMIPCAEMVRFVKTGSEACQAAVRIARRATGRDGVLVCGYHGWHDWYIASKPSHPGVPDLMSGLVDSFKYNDPEDMQTAAGDIEGGVAAIILEPTLFEEPKPGFLEAVRQYCTERGIILIFDEMVTGFRWDEGGYQRFSGVTPDLATFGKAMANGYPLACVVGKRGLMEMADVVSGTFGGEAIGLAACQATMNLYEETGAIRSIWNAGNRILKEFRSTIYGADLPARMDGPAVHPRIIFNAGDAELNAQCLALYVQEMAAEGVLIHPAGWNVAEAHDNDRDVEQISNASEIAAHRVKMALQSESVKEELRGSGPSAGVRA